MVHTFSFPYFRCPSFIFQYLLPLLPLSYSSTHPTFPTLLLAYPLIFPVLPTSLCDNPCIPLLYSPKHLQFSHLPTLPIPCMVILELSPIRPSSHPFLFHPRLSPYFILLFSYPLLTLHSPPLLSPPPLFP